jgi:hypothetical protein
MTEYPWVQMPIRELTPHECECVQLVAEMNELETAWSRNGVAVRGDPDLVMAFNIALADVRLLKKEEDSTQDN